MRHVNNPLFLGRGFDWEASDAQAARDILARDSSALRPPDFYQRSRERLGLASRRDPHGQEWINAIGLSRAADRYTDMSNMLSHVGVLGSTGAGKGRIFELLMMQCIANGDAVVVFDPKMDIGMVDRGYAEMARRGRPEDFKFFSTAYPEISCRINPFQNFAGGAQLASRATSLVPGGGKSDNFKAFAWKAINNCIQGMLLAGEPPSLKRLRYYVGGNVEDLFVRAFGRFMKQNEERFPGWEDELKRRAQRDRGAGIRGVGPKTNAAIAYYKEKVVLAIEASEPLDGLVEVLTHPGDHYQKMITTIAPQMTALTTGETRLLLSPDYDDFEDERDICNMREVLRKGQVLYVHLNSLGDSQSAEWIGDLLLADLTACAADRYNFGDTEREVAIFCDEVNELISEAMIKALNKARGAKMKVFWATQSVSDLKVRFGDSFHATQTLGVTNTLYAMRVHDEDTKRALVDRMRTTRTQIEDESHNSRTSVEDRVDFHRGTASRTAYTDGQAAVPSDLLEILPDLQAFVSLHDGRRLMLRIPFMPVEPELQFPGLKQAR